MSDDTERITVRVDGSLYEEMQAVLDDVDELNQSQLVRAGIRREIAHRTGDGVDDVLARLESATTDVQRQVARLERLPLE